jgi:hypothetical protein
MENKKEFLGEYRLPLCGVVVCMMVRSAICLVATRVLLNSVRNLHQMQKEKEPVRSGLIPDLARQPIKI